ncbi:MAG: BrnA antitoxin family protein [Candidatus Krumholzibacteria bacterium]|nr:BrnA antitoxin family protein [Candidatus Krumholzibacteria bacterium]
MRKHYDFSKMKARRNPYVKLLKQSVTIRLDKETVEYFKGLAGKTGVPYQHLINLYLRDCAARQKELAMRWVVNGRRTTRCTRRSAAQPASER